MSKGGKVDTEKEFVWIDNSTKQAASKFQLNYKLKLGFQKVQRIFFRNV